MSNSISNIDLEGVAKLFCELDNFVICGHTNPDGDCIGSALVLGEALHMMGKKALCLLADENAHDPNLSFLPGLEDMGCAAGFSGEIGAFVLCDVSAPDRMGKSVWALHEAAQNSFTIDHHSADVALSRYNYFDTSKASTTMIAWELVAKLGLIPTRSMALCAYAGLVSDTGNFMYQNTDSAAFAAAGEMIGLGIKPSEISRLLYQERSLEALRLESILLSRIELDAGRRFVLSYLSWADFEGIGAKKADAELMIDVLRSLGGVRVACFVRETENGIRTSFRAKDETDVSLIAKRFGGGGHKGASGCTIQGSLDEALVAVRAALNEIV